MTGMHTPLTLPTGVAHSAPDGVEALGWGALEGLETARPGLELDVAWCERRRFKAKPGDALVAQGEGGRVDVVLGFGDREHFGAMTLRQAAGAFAGATGEAKTAALDLTGITRLGIGAEQAMSCGNRGFLGGSIPLHALPRQAIRIPSSRSRSLSRPKRSLPPNAVSSGAA